MIQAFPDPVRVEAGGDLVLYVSTDAPRFSVELYRFGPRLEFVDAVDGLAGEPAPAHLPHHDWGADNVGLRGRALRAWAAHTLPVPAAWRPGVYLAVLVEANGDAHREAPAVDARVGRALFVVAPPPWAPPAPLLYKLPLFTYHAYNQASPQRYDGATRQGGWALYTIPSADQLPEPVPPAVSLRRPGGGTGGTPCDMWNFDPFDPTPRQTFVHWDGPFIAWLERNGYRVDYCTDSDLLRDDAPDLLARYPLLVSAGHDEYWSDGMRDHVERYVRQGGNVAFFGGNTCWWRIVFDNEWSFRRTSAWWEADGGARPENDLTGVSFRNGGERDCDHHPLPVGFRVQHADHWVFAGTGLGDGDTFGDGPGEYLVGYECDGAVFDRAAAGSAKPVVATGEDGTPASFTILGVGDVAASGWGTGNRAATLGLHGETGTVFTAATTDWARLLGRHAVVEQITANVLDRLASPVTAAGPGPRRA